MKWRGMEESKPATAHATLKAALDERRELMRRYVPADVQALNRRAVEELRLSGMAQRVLPAGVAAPPFELPDQIGQLVSSHALLARGRLVIIFFRGRWCPFCVAQLEAWNDLLPQLRAAGAELAGISPQTVHQSSLMHDQHRLAFPLLSDAANRVARQFGLVYQVPEYQQQLFTRTFVNLPFINGDSSWELPLPATYVVDRDGTVLYASADADYTLRPEPAEVVNQLRAT